MPLFKTVFQRLSCYIQEHLVQHILQTTQDTIPFVMLSVWKIWCTTKPILLKLVFCQNTASVSKLWSRRLSMILDRKSVWTHCKAWFLRMLVECQWLAKLIPVDQAWSIWSLLFVGWCRCHRCFRDENGKVRMSLSKRVADNIHKILT